MRSLSSIQFTLHTIFASLPVRVPHRLRQRRQAEQVLDPEPGASGGSLAERVRERKARPAQR